MRRTQKAGQCTIALAALPAVLFLAGCMKEVPIVSTEKATTVMTLDEQREWVEDQLDAGVDATGVSEGWYWGSATKIPWSDRPEGRERILGSWFPGGCDGHAGQLDASIRIKDGVEDPAGVAARLRAFWEAEGWVVTDVRSNASERDPYFRADREDGAGLSFQASEKGMSLSVYSACSSHNTVTDWQSYVDDEPNEFEEELERRELDAG